MENKGLKKIKLVKNHISVGYIFTSVVLIVLFVIISLTGLNKTKIHSGSIRYNRANTYLSNLDIASNDTKLKSTITTRDNMSSISTRQYAWSSSPSIVPTTWTNFTEGQTVENIVSTKGSYYLWTRVVDSAGNIQQSPSSVFTVNDSSILISPSATTWTSSSVTLTVTYGAGLTQNRKYKLGVNGTWTNMSGTTLVVPSNNMVYFSAQDIAGNEVISSIQVSNIDKILPNAAVMTLPNDGQIGMDDPKAYNINISDNIGGSGIDLTKSKYKFSTTSTVVGINDTAFWNASDAYTMSSESFSFIKGLPETCYLHVLTVDKAGNKVSNISGVINVTRIIFSNVNTNYYDITIYGLPKTGVGAVRFPIWTNANGQDDTIWHVANDLGNGVWTCRIYVRDHKFESGIYINHAYWYDGSNQLISSFQVGNSVTVPAPSVYVSASGSNGYEVRIDGVPEGINSMYFPTWTAYNGQDDILWHGTAHQGGRTWAAWLQTAAHNYENGRYITHIYGYTTSDCTGQAYGFGGVETDISGASVPPHDHYGGRNDGIIIGTDWWSCGCGNSHNTARRAMCCTPGCNVWPKYPDWYICPNHGGSFC